MDYVLNLINNRMALHLYGDDVSDWRLRVTKWKAEYILRLFFAVTVDNIIIRGRSSEETPWNLVSNLWRCTPDDMLADVQKRRPYLSEPFAEVWDGPLSRMANALNRVSLYAMSAEDAENAIREIESAIVEAEKLTEGKYFSTDSKRRKYSHRLLYIQNEKTRLSSYEGEPFRQFPRGTDEGDLNMVRRIGTAHDSDPVERQLYLIIVEQSSTECFRLSPFLSLDMEKENGVLLYDCGLQALDSYADLQYKPLFASDSSAGRAGNFRVTLSCELPSLISDSVSSNQRVYRHFPIRDEAEPQKRRIIEINLLHTRSPDARSSLGKQDFQYCGDICPQAKRIAEYCTRLPGEHDSNYCVIKGEGGLGKTALAFHIINDCVLKGKTEYARVIFLSAKQFQVNYDRSVYNDNVNMETRIEQDFSTYREFLLRLSELLLESDSDSATDSLELEDKVLRSIREKIPPTLLIVDDLDSLTNIEEQKKIIALIDRARGAKLYALITTRNRDTQASASVMLERLDKEKCVVFLKWCLENVMGMTAEQSSKLCADTDKVTPELILEYTEGRPFDLKHCAKLLQNGLPIEREFNRYVSPRQRTIYLCRRSLSMVGETERHLFHFICAFNSALQGKKLGEEVDFSAPLAISRKFLLVLQIRGLETRNSLDNALGSLQDWYLLVIQGDDECAIRKNLVYSELLNGASPLDDYLDDLLDEVKKHPSVWKGAGWQDTLPDYLYAFYANRPRSESFGAVGQRRIVTGLLENRNILTGEQLSTLNDIRLLSSQDFSQDFFQEEQPRKSPSLNDIDFSNIPEGCAYINDMIKGLGNLTGINYDMRFDLIEACLTRLTQYAKTSDDRTYVEKTREYFSARQRMLR